MKKTARKLKLNRETLRNLTEPRLHTIVGGDGDIGAYSVQDTDCTGCDVSPLCGPTMEVGCETT